MCGDLFLTTLATWMPGPALCIDYRGSTPRALISDLGDRERLDTAVLAALGATPRTAMMESRAEQMQQARALMTL